MNKNLILILRCVHYEECIITCKCSLYKVYLKKSMNLQYFLRLITSLLSGAALVVLLHVMQITNTTLTVQLVAKTYLELVVDIRIVMWKQ